MEESGYWTARTGRTLSRRRLLATTSLGSAGLAFAVACSRTSGPKPAGSTPPGRAAANPAGGAPGPAAQQAKRGGTLVRPNGPAGAATKPFDAGLDAHQLQPQYTGPMSMFYQTLLRLNPRTAALEAELAQKWEQPSPTEYLFHLQPNVKFHNKPPANGRPMTADDAVFSLNRVRTNDPKFQNRLLLNSVDQFTAPDKATLRVTTKDNDVSILTNLASFSMAVLAPEVVDKAGKFSTPDSAVGTGAFVLQSFDDTVAVVVRNPDYWKPGLPYLDAIRSQYILEAPAQWAAFLSGQIQVTTNPLSGPDAKQADDQQKGKDYVAEWYKDVSFPSLQANLKRKPFDDARVTHALRLLVDHQEAANQWAVTWFGRGYLGSVLPAALDGWDFAEQEYQTKFVEFKTPKDEAVKQALALLLAAGFTKDNPLKFALTGNNSGFAQDYAQLHQAQLNRNGQGTVQVTNLQLFDLAQLNTIEAQGNFDYFISGLVAPQPYDVDSWFSTIYHTGGGRNYGKFSDPTLDAMFDKQRTIFDVGQRKAAVKDILSYMVDHSPYTSWSGRQFLNVSYKKVHGWAPEGVSAMWGYNYEQVWLE